MTELDKLTLNISLALKIQHLYMFTNARKMYTTSKLQGSEKTEVFGKILQGRFCLCFYRFCRLTGLC